MAYLSESHVSIQGERAPGLVPLVAQTPAISIARVGKTFPRTRGEPLRVLDDISFDVPQGQITAILGASGCGKSTLLNIIAGLVRADQGLVRLNGVPVPDFDDWSRIGYLFQDDRLLPWRTALKNVELGLEAEHVRAPRRRELAHQALASVGLAGFEHTYPGELSGGMRSRVALARSLVKDPTTLLLDEPFSKLDPSMRAQMHQELLRAQQDKQLSVAFVTHDLEEAVILADHVVILHPNPGRVQGRIDIDLPRPRRLSGADVSEQIRTLRDLV